MAIRIGKPVTPKEHGAWLVLGVALFTGSFAVKPEGSFLWPGFVLLSTASLTGFMALTPFRRLLIGLPGVDTGRNLAWLIVYLAISAGCFLTLVIRYKLNGLFWFILPASILTAAYLWWSVTKAERTLLVEAGGMAGLALAGPAASYVQQSGPTAEGAALYLLMIIWFVDRAMMARKIVDSIRGKVKFDSISARARRYLPEFLIHLGALMSVVVVIIMSDGLVPWMTLAPFLLATAKNLADTLSIRQENDPMRAGFSEMRLGMVFGLIMVVVWRI